MNSATLINGEHQFISTKIESDSLFLEAQQHSLSRFEKSSSMLQRAAPPVATLLKGMVPGALLRCTFISGSWHRLGCRTRRPLRRTHRSAPPASLPPRLVRFHARAGRWATTPTMGYISPIISGLHLRRPRSFWGRSSGAITSGSEVQTTHNQLRSPAETVTSCYRGA